MKHWNQTIRLVLLGSIVLALVLGAIPPASLKAATAAKGSADADLLVETVAAPLAEPPPPYESSVVQWAQSVEGEERTVLLSWREAPRAAHQIFLPLVVRSAQGQVAAASNPLAGAGSQATLGSTIYRRAGSRSATVAASTARAPSILLGYTVYRRITGDTEWQALATTSPAANVGEMEVLLGSVLAAQLAWDLAPEGATEPLTMEELYEILMSGKPHVRLLAEEYYQVGLVLGLAYLDRPAPAGRDVEYYIAKGTSTNPLYAPVRVRDGTDPGIPTGLTEVWSGPELLGQPGSSQPSDAEERYHWDHYQQYRSWDGTVYLIWDVPEGEPRFDGKVLDDYQGTDIAGYHVYRKSPLFGRWELVNPSKDNCATPGSRYCVLQIRPGAINPRPASAIEEPYFFKENLKDKYQNRSSIYTSWLYRVCSVDLLGNEACSGAITAYGRDLHPPAMVKDVQVDEPDGGPIELSWVYSDTDEINLPLRMYVTRSPTVPVPLEDWEPVTPEGNRVPYIEVPVTTTLEISITDSPPEGIPYWYRVQVRDDAGNWSPVSSPILGALYPRTPPPFDPIDYNDLDCSANPMPLRLGGLDPRVSVIAVYRSFAPDGPWQLIDKVVVTEGQVEIADDYLPPYPRDMYYRLEAWDGHGNVSEAHDYCTHPNPGTVPPPPTDVTVNAGCDGGVCDASITWTDHNTGTKILVTQAGILGPETRPWTTDKDTFALDFAPGAMISVTLASQNENGTGEGTTFWIQETNNFLNTNREMTDLGPIHEIEWITETVPAPVARINLTGWCDPEACDPKPLVSIFRRFPNGNWMQVSTVQEVYQAPLNIHAPWIVTDTAALMPFQTYEYVVLAHSPTSYEVLGFWGPSTLNPLEPDPEPVAFFGRLDPNPEWPIGTCEGRSSSPGDLGMPAVINMHNGWTIDVQKYTLYDPPGAPDPTCPPSAADADHLSGLGTLGNGSQTWPNVTFFDIAVDPGTGNHLSGRIVVTLNTAISGDPTRFDAFFDQVEFEGVQSRVEVMMTLPANLSVRGPGGTHFSNRIFGQFANVGTDLTGSGFSGNNLTLADENLPWLLSYEDSYISYRKVMLDEASFALTSYRLGYPAPRIEHPAAPDNNLGFLRPEYTTTDVYADRNGLHGSFTTSGPFTYSTSFPAAVVVGASVGAAVNIADSTIQDGTLYGAGARLDYFDRGKTTDYMVVNNFCGREFRQIGMCPGFLGQDVPGDSYRTLMLSPVGGDVAIGLEGKMLPGVNLDQTVVWPSFEVQHTDARLFVASAAFADAPSSWAPMPAENAWRQLLDPGTGFDYDPGINLNFRAGDAYYACFDPGTLEEVAIDLHVRRGGVSEYLLFENGPSRWFNSRGYQEKIERMELIFVDNLPASIEDYRTLLDLPYPSDATLPLTVETVDPNTNCALSGDIDPLGQVTHQYWRFAQRPTDWYYTSDLSKYEGVLGRQEELLALQGEAIFTGLNPQTTAAPGIPVTRAVVSEWLPNGDIGDLNLDNEPLPAAGYRVSGIYYSLSDVMLSSYYSDPMNESSLPDTLGLDLRYNMVELPKELLLNGELTPNSLKQCARDTRVGCGFVVLDGEGAVQFFGEIEPESLHASSITATGLPFGSPTGSFPILSNRVVNATVALVLHGPQVHWVWPVLNDALDFPIPLKFLGNTEGGALAMVLKDARLFPAPMPSLLHTDVGLAITFDWSASDGFFDEIGIQLGYAASQAAFRALAMNRPLTETAGTRPYQKWAEVEADITEWAQKFNYSIGPGEEDDPVDLAERIWESWGNQPFGQAFNILEPVLDGRNGSDAYGITGIEPQLHDVLDWANVELNTGMAQMVYVQTSLTNGYIEMLRFGGEFRARFEAGPIDPLLGIDWLSLVEYNKDGEFLIHGEDLQISMLGEFYPLADFDLLIGTKEGNQRVEGGIDFEELEIPSLFSLDLSGVFGSGQFGGQEIFFIGVTLDTGWTMETEQGSAMPDLEIGVSVIAGTLPSNSQIIRNYGYGDVLDKFASESIEGAPPTFSGFYAAIYIDDWHPVYSGCLLDVGAGGELRVWYFTTSGGQELWGGQLSAHIYAEVACLVSARGQLALTLEQILGGSQTSPPPGETHGWSLWDRTCPGNPSTDTCLSFSGTFWAAAGVGWCEPGSWDSWSSRWWGDSWCYTFGAIAGVSYLEHADTPWDWDYDLDYE